MRRSVRRLASSQGEHPPETGCPSLVRSSRPAHNQCVSQDKPVRASTLGTVALANIQIDVTTRLGTPRLSTTSGLPTLDLLLGGGLRPGTLLGLVSRPGGGRTTLALLLAYMAARSKAVALFSSVGLDDTEVVARLAARALHRERPDAQVPYGSIWSGKALQEAELMPAVLNAVDTVMRKVGGHLHLYRAASLEPTGTLAERAAQLWSRSDRVLLVVDDIEGFYASADGSASKQAAVNATLAGRITQVAFDLKAIAEQGCAVVVTGLARHADLLAPAADAVAEISQPLPTGAIPEALLTLGARNVELCVLKNRLGSTGVVALRLVPGVGLVEERGRAE